MAAQVILVWFKANGAIVREALPAYEARQAVVDLRSYGRRAWIEGPTGGRVEM